MFRSAAAPRRSTPLTPAPRARLLALAGLLAGSLALAQPPRAAAADAGGTAAGGAPVGATSNPAKTGGAQPKAKPSLHVLSVRITGVSCVPYPNCSGNPHQVSLHGDLELKGVGLRSGMVVAFPRYPGARVTKVSPAAHLRQTPSGLDVEVPKTAHSGHIMILLSGGRYTSSYGPIYVYSHALHPPPPKDPPPAGAASAAVSGTAFEGQGMWIWYLSASDGGNLAAIVAQAHAAGVTTLYVKSSDGSSNYWSQFSPQLVATLHANGLRVCAWQFVYGSEPVGEAALGAEAVADGADCLVIDAEGEYEGRYAAAQTYIADLRAKIGSTYPLGLASFPYVYDHPSFPYSVFLGPDGAQYDAPQMYWHDIGQSVDTTYANTWISNRIYQRPIFPLGQTFEHVSAAELLRFREEAVDYGATGTSYWDWQETGASQWSTLAAPLEPLTSVAPNTSWPELVKGNSDDSVLWMQEHLASAIPTQEVTGIFGAQTLADVESFQSAHGIAPSGVVEAATWTALLALPPVAVDWTGAGPKD
ncbi:MAG TPA: peptidoglycan-binding domain-containing protein [Solirubrobacteraceae bacterium]|jgi:peptidoglycan hydrolase-like protein with peptidoglycan-binding domain|nr:peptidoglycan-binding domain-containing protein [Solirubrobacteraceae bacterium]